MSKSQPIARFTELAERIAEDIHRRKLRPGDPYLSTAEVARHFSVSGVTANKALQLLQQRRLLDRRQRSGTFVAEPVSHGGSPLQRVHLLAHENYLKTEGLLADGLLMGLQSELPGAELQFNFLPGADEASYVHSVIVQSLRSRAREGFVLFRASVETQRTVHACGLPSVVCGTLHPSAPSLCQIDRDQRQIGALLADYLLRHGSRQIAILLRDRITAGDHQLLDGAFETLSRAGIGLDALTFRGLAADEPSIQAAVAEILGQSTKPLGILCRSEPLAQGVLAAIEERGLAGRRRPALCVADLYRSDPADPPFTYARSTLEPVAMGQAIGSLLAQQARGEPIANLSRAVSVELVEPRDTSTKAKRRSLTS